MELDNGSALIPVLLLAAALGWCVWTLVEYVFHRWVGHARGALRPLGRIHMAHHRDPEGSTLAQRVRGYAATLLCVVLAAATGRAPVLAFAIGYAIGHAVYEVSHWHFHRGTARTALGRSLRDRHRLHHRGGVGANFSVTLPVWDIVFGTSLSASDRVSPPPTHRNESLPSVDASR